jgi:uroporphyrinogen decarboxylase
MNLKIKRRGSEGILMNGKEVILKAISCEGVGTAKRLPVSLLSGGTWTFRQKEFSLRDVLEQPQTASDVIVDLSQIIQSDIVWPGSGYHNLLVHVFGGEVKFRHLGNIDVLRPLFQKIADVDNLHLEQLDKHEWIANLRSIIGDVAHRIDQEYLVGTSSWGPFTLAGQFYGVEKLMTGVYKDKQGVHALMELMTEVCFRYLAPTIAKGATILSIAEPTASGDLISLRHFEEFIAPYLVKVIRKLKEHRVLITLHICGNIKDRIHLVPELGIDLLSVDYKVDLPLAQKILNGKVALAGNVNPIILKDKSPEEVKVAVEKSLHNVDTDHFVLMPGCDIPPTVPLANVQAFIAAGLNYKG